MTMNTLWNVDQLAAFLGVPKTWIYDRTGGHGVESIPHLKLGKYLRFDPNSEEFKAWLKQCTHNG